MDKMNNHVVKVTDANVNDFLADGGNGGGPRALLFTDKNKVTPLLKGLAIEFLGVLPVGQVRSGETETVTRFGVTSFPTLVLVPGGGAEPEVYDGEMKKPAMVAFLSKVKVAATNPTGAHSDAADTADTTTTKPSATAQVTAPVIVDVPPIPTLATADKVAARCLGPKSSTCVLVLLPEGEGAHSIAHKALETLAGSALRHSRANAHFLPFFAVAHDNGAGAEIREALDLKGDVEIVALNGRRGWWRHYDGGGSDGAFGTASVEAWIDSIRMGEGVKSRLPEGLVKSESKGTAATEGLEPSETPVVKESDAAAAEHEEL